MHRVVGPIEIEVPASGSRLLLGSFRIRIDGELSIGRRDGEAIAPHVWGAAGKPLIQVTTLSERFKVSVRSAGRFQLQLSRGDGPQRLNRGTFVWSSGAGQESTCPPSDEWRVMNGE